MSPDPSSECEQGSQGGQQLRHAVPPATGLWGLSSSICHQRHPSMVFSHSLLQPLQHIRSQGCLPHPKPKGTLQSSPLLRPENPASHSHTSTQHSPGCPCQSLDCGGLHPRAWPQQVQPTPSRLAVWDVERIPGSSGFQLDTLASIQGADWTLEISSPHRHQRTSHSTGEGLIPAMVVLCTHGHREQGPDSRVQTLSLKPLPTPGSVSLPVCVHRALGQPIRMCADLSRHEPLHLLSCSADVC